MKSKQIRKYRAMPTYQLFEVAPAAPESFVYNRLLSSWVCPKYSKEDFVRCMGCNTLRPSFSNTPKWSSNSHHSVINLWQNHPAAAMAQKERGGVGKRPSSPACQSLLHLAKMLLQSCLVFLAWLVLRVFHWFPPLSILIFLLWVPTWCYCPPPLPAHDDNS